MDSVIDWLGNIIIILHKTIPFWPFDLIAGFIHGLARRMKQQPQLIIKLSQNENGMVWQAGRQFSASNKLNPQINQQIKLNSIYRQLNEVELLN